MSAIPESHNDKAFNLGKTKSVAPIITGRRILPKPPIKIGIIIKKIINKPWNVKFEVYCWAVESTNPKIAFSTLKSMESPKPIKPPKIPETRYNPPIITWFVVHLSKFIKYYKVKYKNERDREFQLIKVELSKIIK